MTNAQSSKKTILYSCEDGLGRLVLNDAKRHNALGQYELDQLHDLLLILAQDEKLRALVVSGAGMKTFCSGAALDQLHPANFNGDNFAKVTEQLSELAVPTLCALNGNVFGAGVDLALACDFRIGLVGSRLQIPAAEIGVCYPAKSIHRVVNQLGVSCAKQLLMLAQTFDDQRMYDCGFLHELVEPKQLQGRVNQWYVSISELAPLSIKSMKQIIDDSAWQGLDADSVKGLSESCFSSQDFVEGMQAKKEKRTPRFIGK